MRQFYKVSQKWQTMSAKLSWIHIKLIIPLEDMNYINQNFKSIYDNETVGIIICKENNEYVIKYCSDKRIVSREYNLV